MVSFGRRVPPGLFCLNYKFSNNKSFLNCFKNICSDVPHDIFLVIPIPSWGPDRGTEVPIRSPPLLRCQSFFSTELSSTLEESFLCRRQGVRDEEYHTTNVRGDRFRIIFGHYDKWSELEDPSLLSRFFSSLDCTFPFTLIRSYNFEYNTREDLRIGQWAVGQWTKIVNVLGCNVFRV